MSNMYPEKINNNAMNDYNKFHNMRNINSGRIAQHNNRMYVEKMENHIISDHHIRRADRYVVSRVFEVLYISQISNKCYVKGFLSYYFFYVIQVIFVQCFGWSVYQQWCIICI